MINAKERNIIINDFFLLLEIGGVIISHYHKWNNLNNTNVSIFKKLYEISWGKLKKYIRNFLQSNDDFSLLYIEINRKFYKRNKKVSHIYIRLIY